MSECVFCRRTKLNKCICTKNKANKVYFYKAHNESQSRPTQWNLSPIGVRNQWKFATNSSPIRIKIPTCAPVSILDIRFSLDVQSRWPIRKINLKGYNFLVNQKS